MLEELRLYPWVPSARTGGCPAVGGAWPDQEATKPSLSTGFAERPRHPVHSAAGLRKEGVG